MNAETKEYLKRVDELELKLTGEDKETFQWVLFGYNECARILEETEQENRQLKEKLNCDLKWALKYDELHKQNQQLKEELKDENNYHNEAVKWYKEAFDREQEIIKYKSVLDEIRELINNHNRNAGKLYYKCNNRYLLSEIKEDILQILDKVGKE